MIRASLAPVELRNRTIHSSFAFKSPGTITTWRLKKIPVRTQLVLHSSIFQLDVVYNAIPVSETWTRVLPRYSRLRRVRKSSYRSTELFVYRLRLYLFGWDSRNRTTSMTLGGWIQSWDLQLAEKSPIHPSLDSTLSFLQSFITHSYTRFIQSSFSWQHLTYRYDPA